MIDCMILMTPEMILMKHCVDVPLIDGWHAELRLVDSENSASGDGLVLADASLGFSTFKVPIRHIKTGSTGC